MRYRKPKQLDLLGDKKRRAYGGDLMKTRKGRAPGGRPLVTKLSMHLVLRSSKAKGAWSFKKESNEEKILEIVLRLAAKYHVKIYSLANVGNHLHFHIKLNIRDYYEPFIRALSGAIAMAVSGISRWNKMPEGKKLQFWDYRPYTTVVMGQKQFLNLRDYIQINEWEGLGVDRDVARYVLRTRPSSA